MPLDCGDAAIVVELDRAPERAWMKSLKRALLADDAMEGAQAKFDGRFVYVVGVDGGGHRAQHRVMQAVMAAGGACASNPAPATCSRRGRIQRTGDLRAPWVQHRLRMLSPHHHCVQRPPDGSHRPTGR
jgi:hypothetical protein